MEWLWINISDLMICFVFVCCGVCIESKIIFICVLENEDNFLFYIDKEEW